MLEKLKRIDWLIVIILLCFMVISTLLVHSAIANQPKFSDYDQRNLIVYAAGFVVFFATIFLDYRLLMKVSPVFYGIGLVLLVAVYFLGTDINGAQGWFELPGGFSFQPAELMKLAIIMLLAYLLSKKNGEQLGLIRDAAPYSLVAFIPFALVMAQPDLGNAIIYMIILVGMLWIGNLKLKYVLGGIIVFVAFMASFLFLYQTYHDDIYKYLEQKGNSHWMTRIDTFLNPDEVSSDAIYHVYHSKIAIGTGGLTGEGYLQGDWVEKGFVPYMYSDSIFAVIGEEFGFIGSSILLLLYFLLIYRMIIISLQASHISGAYMIVGIVSMFVFQVFENVGMLIGLMPLTGITLPFISYGGTSLLINMLSIGLVMSVKVHQEKKSMFLDD
ncbi:FtsW/RodA/SpoVE family cell cycle protein [Marinicrinis lubricantis]|uniref:FtsW/RodA/SpoVE family cell cycle protein n=1 Tax=Marinicrinis lubricantis TaxID=2086470 RepID=A0ABW1IU02_9BACL